MFATTLAYAGIGARDTPDHELKLMTMVGRFMSDYGFTLRSGGAEGADTAFEKGCDLQLGEKEIFLPWKGFNRHTSNLFQTSPAAFTIAQTHHPYWGNLKQGARALMARNSHQVLGHNLNDPVKCIICWTPGGKVTGGTGQALRIAKHFGIPIINLGHGKLDEAEDQLQQIVSAEKVA